MSEALETGVIMATVGLTYVTALAAYPYEVRQAHLHKVVRVGKAVTVRTVTVGSNLIYLTRYHGRLVAVRVVHHGRWLLWQLCAILPYRFRSRG
jgi:hypothetical protein